MARPEYVQTDKDRSVVQTMAAYGISQAEIAAVIGCDDKTLRKHFREELDTAAPQANARVAASLFKKATGDGASSVAAAIFWLKARANWRETANVELTGKDGGPVQTINASALSAAAMREILEASDAATEADES